MWSTTCILPPLRTKAHSKTYFFFKRFSASRWSMTYGCSSEYIGCVASTKKRLWVCIYADALRNETGTSKCEAQPAFCHHSERKLIRKPTFSSRDFPPHAEAWPTVGHQNILDVLLQQKEGCGFAFTLTRWGTKQAQVNVKHNLHCVTTQNESSFENLLFLQEIFRLTLKHDLRLVIRIYWMCCFNKKKVVGLHLRWRVEERNRRK